MTGGGSMLVAPGNNISIGGEQPMMEKPSDMVVNHRNRNNNHFANDHHHHHHHHGNPAVSPGGSSNGSFVGQQHRANGRESPASISSGSSAHEAGLHNNSGGDKVRSHGTKSSTTASSSSSSSDDQPSQQIITKLHHHDCILGRGGFTNNYVGNANFRKLVNQHKMRYLSCNKIEKPKVARDVVRLWKQLDPPGRFLIKKEYEGNGKPKKGEPTVWVQCSDKKAQEKASQSLRERTPDVLPYLSKLQEHRDQMREQGVSLISQHYQDSIKGGEPFLNDSGNGSFSSPGDLHRNTFMGSAGAATLSPHRHPHHHPSQFGMHPGMDQSMNSSMNRSMNGSHATPSMMHGMDPRRMSMPAGGAGGGGGPPVPVTPEEMRSHMSAARRTSMPTINHLQGGGGGMPGMDAHHHHHYPDQHPSSMMGGAGGGNANGMMPFDLERQRHHVLQDAYGAMDRHGNVDPHTNRMFMEQMMIREQELMQQRQAMVRGHHMMQAMQSPPFVGSMGGPVTRDCDVMMPEHQDMMLAAAQKQQQLLHESMKKSMIEKHREEVLKQQLEEKEQEKKFLPPISNNNNGKHSQEPPRTVQPFARPQHPGESGFDIEPLPFDVDSDDYEIPLTSIVPEVAKSTPEASGYKRSGPSSPKKSPAGKSKKASSLKKAPGNAKKSPKAPSPPKKASKSVASGTAIPPPDATLPLNDTIPAPSTGTSAGKLKSAFKNSAPAVSRESFQSSDSDKAGNEYRKTLEGYMVNHQNAAASAVDIDDDISDSEGDIGGVDATAWIQQALNSSSVDGSVKNNKRKKKRRNSRQDPNADDMKDNTNHDSTGFGPSTHTLDLMSTDGKSMDCGKSVDCKSLECMSFMSLAMSEMEKSMEQLHVDKTPPSPPKGVSTGPSRDDDSDMLEDESINFGSPNGDLRKRAGMSSNQSVMSELTDFSDNGDSDNEDGLGFERDIVI